jgi:hypothetical protein
VTAPRNRRRSGAAKTSGWLVAVVGIYVVGFALLLVVGSVVARQLRVSSEPVPELVAALSTLTPTPAGTPEPASPPPATAEPAAPSLAAPTGALPAATAGDTLTSVVPAASATGIAASATVAAATRVPAPGATGTTPTADVTATAAATPTVYGSPAATPTDSPEPSPASTPSATGTVNAISVRNDQACLEPETGDLYLFGELANQGTAPYDVDDVHARVFGASGELSVAGQQFDMPGNFFVPAGGSLPFVLVIRLGSAQFSRYQVDVAAEPGAHTPRSDLTIEEFQTTRVFDLVEVTGRWAHGGARPDQFVSIVAATYDAQGRVSNMSYLYLPAGTLDSGDLPAGQYRFERLYLLPSPCGEGTLRVSVVGE